MKDDKIYEERLQHIQYTILLLIISNIYSYKDGIKQFLSYVEHKKYNHKDALKEYRKIINFIYSIPSPPLEEYFDNNISILDTELISKLTEYLYPEKCKKLNRADIFMETIIDCKLDDKDDIKIRFLDDIVKSLNIILLNLNEIDSTLRSIKEPECINDETSTGLFPDVNGIREFNSFLRECI